MSSISWCKQQSKGIQIIRPNDNLTDEYFRTAEESLLVLNKIKETRSNTWLATTKYYIEYFGVYAVLMKIGLKCEIHECTIALVRLLEKESVFTQGTAERLEEDKELRIDNQYYLKNRPVTADSNQLSDFLLNIKSIIDKISDEEIKSIREIIKKV